MSSSSNDPRPNPARRDAVRQMILVALHESRPVGYGADTLRRLLRAEGLNLDEVDVHNELSYLADKGLVTMRRAALSAASVRWHVTADGIDLLEEEGLV